MGKNYSQALYGLDYVDVKAIFKSHEAKMHKLPEFDEYLKLVVNPANSYSPICFEKFGVNFLDGLFNGGEHELIVNEAIENADRYWDFCRLEADKGISVEDNDAAQDKAFRDLLIIFKKYEIWNLTTIKEKQL